MDCSSVLMRSIIPLSWQLLLKKVFYLQSKQAQIYTAAAWPWDVQHILQFFWEIFPLADYTDYAN